MKALPQLLCQCFFPDVATLRTWPHLLGAPVVMVPFLPLPRDGAAAMVTRDEAQEWERSPLGPVVSPAPALQDLLNPVKQLLGYQGIMGALMFLALELEESNVERIRQQAGQGCPGDEKAAMCAQVPAFHYLVDFRESVLTRGIEPKQFANHGGFRIIDDDGSQSGFVEVTDWRLPWVFATAELLTNTPADILGKVVYVVFGLPERHVQHEFALGCVVEPEGRKLQR